MEMMKRMIVGFVLVAAFALPAFAAATLEKDVITLTAVRSVLEKVSPNLNMGLLNEQTISALTGKILISNPLVEEALLKSSNVNALGGGDFCGETCAYLPCATFVWGCSCTGDRCTRNSLAN